MIKVIASDMDGTLLGDNHKVAPETVEAIREAQAAGIRFMIATGRSYNGAMDFHHPIVTCLFSMLRLSFDIQKVNKSYTIFSKRSRRF